MNTKNIKPLLNALKELRWDELDQSEVKEQWNRMFKGGYVPEFYLHTLEQVLELGKEANKERKNAISKAMKAIS